VSTSLFSPFVVLTFGNIGCFNSIFWGLLSGSHWWVDLYLIPSDYLTWWILTFQIAAESMGRFSGYVWRSSCSST
jgi:hypothetical protein